MRIAAGLVGGQLHQGAAAPAAFIYRPFHHLPAKSGAPFGASDPHRLYLTAPGPKPCGYNDDAAFKAKVCAAVSEMNAQWRVVGYSFRPTIFAVDSSSPAEPPAGAPVGKTNRFHTQTSSIYALVRDE